jgi:hypothetical protein
MNLRRLRYLPDLGDLILIGQFIGYPITLLLQIWIDSIQALG